MKMFYHLKVVSSYHTVALSNYHATNDLQNFLLKSRHYQYWVDDDAGLNHI